MLLGSGGMLRWPKKQTGLTRLWNWCLAPWLPAVPVTFMPLMSCPGELQKGYGVPGIPNKPTGLDRSEGWKRTFYLAATMLICFFF